MELEIPPFVIFVFTYMLILATVGVTCCVIDTVMNVKEYKYWKKQIEHDELEQQVGEIVDAKINPGGGISEDEN